MRARLTGKRETVMGYALTTGRAISVAAGVLLATAAFSTTAFAADAASATQAKPADGWQASGSSIVYYQDGVKQVSQWIVTRQVPTTGKAKTSQTALRYWVDASGKLARNRFIDPTTKRDAKAGYAAAASKSGSVRTSKFTYKKRVLYPSSTGKLATYTGFKKTTMGASGKKLAYWASVPGHPSITGAKTGFFKVKSKRYYASKAGVVFTNGMKKIGKKYYQASTKGVVKRIEKAQYRMVKRAKNRSSRTKYLVMVDTAKTRVGVFQGKKGSWTLKKYWICSVGKKSTPTPKGTFRIYTRGYSFGSGFTCYWYSAFYGGYMLHSQTYYQGTFRIKGGRLGKHCTHGCVRIDLKNAKWVYDHLPLGTTVHTY